MEYSEKIKRIMHNPGFSISSTCPSYIKKLLPDLENGNVIIFYKTKVAEFPYKKKLSAEENEQTDLDVTGSPLEYSFGRDSFSETVISPKRYWLKEEENHLPLVTNDARVALNLCLEFAERDWNVFVIAVCDQSDKQKTVLLGTEIDAELFRTFSIHIQKPKTLCAISDVQQILSEHLKNSTSNPVENGLQVKVDARCTYELFGTQEMFTNWSEITKSDFPGYLRFQFEWHTLSFQPPVKQSKKTLVMEIAAGWKDSPLNHLWEEIKLLNRFLTILEEYQKKHLSSRYSVMPLQFPANFSHPNVKSDEEVMDNLNRLLIGDDTFLMNRKSESKKNSTGVDVENDLKLRQHLEDLPARQNLDFSDYLWMVVKDSENHAQITDCVHAVFQEVEKKEYKPQMNVTNSTRLAKLTSDIIQQKATSPLLAGSLPLEILVDIGIEKLSRDYTYLLMSACLIERVELQEKLEKISSEEIDIQKLRKNLLALSQIHVCLEFAILAETHLDYSSGNLQSLFSCAFKKFTSKDSPIQSFVPLEENSIYTLDVPIPTSIVEQMIVGFPSFWSMRFSSPVSAFTQITSATYYSLVPMFPPDIHCEDETEKSKETTYYAVSLFSSARTI